MSKIFSCILSKICNSKTKEPFRVADVIDCLGSSTSFLAKHAINENSITKQAEGKTYFIRVGEGQYKINPKFKKCQ